MSDARQCDSCGQFFSVYPRLDFDLPVFVQGGRHEVALIVEEAAAREDLCKECLQVGLAAVRVEMNAYVTSQVCSRCGGTGWRSCSCALKPRLRNEKRRQGRRLPRHKRRKEDGLATRTYWTRSPTSTPNRGVAETGLRRPAGPSKFPHLFSFLGHGTSTP